MFLHFWKFHWYFHYSRFFIINIGGSFKYLFSSFSPILSYLSFIVTIIFDNSMYTNNLSSNFTSSYLENINKSQTSLCPTNNVFLFGLEEIVSVSTTAVNTMTSYKSLIFFLIVTIFSSIFYKKSYFKITKQIFPFLIFFSLF